MIDTHPRLFVLLCMLIVLLALGCAWFVPSLARAQAAPIAFTARWSSPTIAAIRWEQPREVHLTCLSRNATLIRCWIDLPEETYIFLLGDTGPLDYLMHPAAGDVYVLTMDDDTWRAALPAHESVRVYYLPLARSGTLSPPSWRVWLATIRR